MSVKLEQAEVDEASAEMISRLLRRTKEAVLDERGYYVIPYADEDERRGPDLDIIPYFFYKPIEKINKRSVNANVKEEPELPLQPSVDRDSEKVVFERHKISIRVGRKSQLVKMGKIIIISKMLAQNGFGFAPISEFFQDKCRKIKLCRKEYKAIVERLITSVWKKLERFMRKHCRYNIIPYTNEEIRMLHNPVQHMKEKLAIDCQETFLNFLKATMQLERVCITTTEAENLYKALRKLVRRNPLYQEELAKRKSKENEVSLCKEPRGRGRTKKSMFHKKFILTGQREMEIQEEQETLESAMKECYKDNQTEEIEEKYQKISERISASTSCSSSTVTADVAKALYYKGYGLAFFDEYLIETDQDPGEMDDTEYRKIAKSIVHRVLLLIEQNVEAQKKKIVEFSPEEEKQVISILLNYKTSLDIRSRVAFQTYLAELYKCGDKVQQKNIVNPFETLHLYKSILRAINIQQGPDEQQERLYLLQQRPEGFDKVEFKRELTNESGFLSQKGLTIDDFERDLVDIFMKNPDTLKVTHIMNREYQHGPPFEIKHITDKMAQIFYRGACKVVERCEELKEEIPEMNFPEMEDCQAMMASKSYENAKLFIFEFLKTQRNDPNSLYLIVSSVNQAMELLRVQQEKVQRTSKKSKKDIKD